MGDKEEDDDGMRMGLWRSSAQGCRQQLGCVIGHRSRMKAQKYVGLWLTPAQNRRRRERRVRPFTKSRRRAAMPVVMGTREGLSSPSQAAAVRAWTSRRWEKRALRGVSHPVPRERSQPAQENRAQGAIAPSIPASTAKAGLAAATSARLDALGVCSGAAISFSISLVTQCKSALLPGWKGSATGIRIPPTPPQQMGFSPSTEQRTPNLQKGTRSRACMEEPGGDQSVDPPSLPGRQMQPLDKSPAQCPADRQLFWDAKLEGRWFPQFPEPLHHSWARGPFSDEANLEHPQPSRGAGNHQHVGSNSSLKLASGLS